MTKKELKELQGRYVTDHAIGVQLGMTRQGVQQWRKKYGIGEASSHHIKHRNKQMKHEYHAGRPVCEIAEHFRMSISQAYRSIK